MSRRGTRRTEGQVSDATRAAAGDVTESQALAELGAAVGGSAKTPAKGKPKPSSTPKKPVNVAEKRFDANEAEAEAARAAASASKKKKKTPSPKKKKTPSPKPKGRGVKRDRGLPRTKDQVIAEAFSKPALRRMARRGGVKRIGGKLYDEVRGRAYALLENILQNSAIYAQHARRKTLTARDVVLGLKRVGSTLYGFGV